MPRETHSQNLKWIACPHELNPAYFALSILTWPNAFGDHWSDRSNDWWFQACCCSFPLKWTVIFLLCACAQHCCARLVNRFKWQSKGISVVDFVIFILWYLIGLHADSETSTDQNAIREYQNPLRLHQHCNYEPYKQYKANMKNVHVVTTFCTARYNDCM